MASLGGPASRARTISYGAILSAVYVVYGAISSTGPLQVLHGVDVHFVRALLLVIVAARVKRFGGPTVMGFVSALLFVAALSTSPAPDFLLLIPATFAAGLAYDLALKGGNYAKNSLNLTRVFSATLVSSFAESVIVTGGLLAIGFNITQSTGLTALLGFSPPIVLVVFILLGRNLLLSIIGAETGGFLLNQINRKPSLKA